MAKMILRKAFAGDALDKDGNILESSFVWVKDGKMVASITLYNDGMFEFEGSGGQVSIESIGTKDEKVQVDGLTIQNLLLSDK